MDKMKNYELTAKIWANINEMRFFARQTEIFRTEFHWMAPHLGSFNHFHAFLITWFEFRSYLIHKIQSTSKMQSHQRTSFRFFHIFWMVSLIEPLFFHFGKSSLTLQQIFRMKKWFQMLRCRINSMLSIWFVVDQNSDDENDSFDNDMLQVWKMA